MAPMEDFDLLGLGNLDPSPPPLAAATPKKSDSKSKISKNKSADTLRSSGSESKQKSEYSAKLESRINRRNSHQNKRPTGEKHYQPVRRVSSSLLDINELDTAPSKTSSSEKERRPHSNSFQASPLLDVVESINLDLDKKAAPLVRGRRISSNNLTELPIKEEETPKGTKETRETKDTVATSSSANNNANKTASMLALDKEPPPKKRSTKDPPKSNGSSDQDPPNNSRPRPRSTLRKSMAKFGDTIKLDAVSRRGRSTGKSVGSKSRTSDKDSNKGERVSEVDQSEKSAFGHKRRTGRSSSRPKRAVTTVDFTSKIDASEKSSGRRKTAGDAVKTTGKKLSQSLGHRSSIKKKDEDGKKSDSKDKVGKKLSQSLGAHKSTDRTSSAKKKEDKKPEDKKDSTPTQTKSKKLSASVGPNSEPIENLKKSKRLSCSTGDADDAFLPLSRRSRTDSQDDLCLLERRSSTTKRATRNNSFNGTDTKDKDRHSHDKDKHSHDKDKGHGNKDKSLTERKLDRRFSDNFAPVTAPQGRKKPTNALRRNSMDESSLNLFGAGTLMKKSPSMNIFENIEKSDKEEDKKGLGIDNADDLLAFTTWGAKKDIVAAKKEKEEKKKKSSDELDDELGAFTTWGKGKKGLDVSTAESSTGKKEKRKTDHTETTKATSKSSAIDASHKEKEHRKKSPPKHPPRPVETATPIATPVVVKGPRVSRITVCAVCFLYIISLGVVGLLGFWMHMMWFPDTTFSISNANEGDGEGNKTVNEGVILNTVGDGAPSLSPLPTGSSAPTGQSGSTMSDGPTYETTYSPTTTPTYTTAKPTRRKNSGKNKPENNNTPKKPGGTKPGKKPNKPAKGQVVLGNKEGSPTMEPKSDSDTAIPTSESTTLTPTESATTYTPTLQPTMTQSPSENPSYPPTISAMPSLSPTGIPSCPDPGELTKMADLGPNAPIKMFYEVVPLPQSDPHAGLLCAAIEYEGNAGWIGIAVSGASRDPAFGRKEAIIGVTGVRTMSVVALPGDEVGIGMQAVNHDSSPWVNPGKYEIPAGGGVDGYTGPSLDTLLPPERQTLLNATISTFGPNEKLKEPVTIMTFTKYLLEPNEIDIIPFNKILFLYAVAAIDEDGEYNDNPEWIVNYLRLLDFESESRSSFGEVKRKRLRGHKGEFG